MSFIPELSEGLTKAWNSTAGAVSGVAQNAGSSVSNFWNWLTGGSNPPPILPDSSSTVSKNPSSDLESQKVTESESNGDGNCQDYSLMHLLHMLRLDSMRELEAKAKIPYLKVKEAQEKNTQLTSLLQVFTSQSENTGEFEVKDDATIQLLTKARNLGVLIPEQAKFTKA